MLANLRQRLDRLATSELDPGRTAAAIALGVFLSFSPFLGLQIVLGLAAAFAFRLSRVAVLLGLCANLPWIMLPWYAITTAAAAAVLGAADGIEVREALSHVMSVPIYHPTFWERSGAVATALVWPFLVGPTLGSLLLAATAYVVSFRALQRRRASAGLAGEAEQRAADRHVDDPQRARLEP